MATIEGLSKKLKFVGELPPSDKPWKVMLWGKRFVLINEDHPPRLVRLDEMKERREPNPDKSEDDGA